MSKKKIAMAVSIIMISFIGMLAFPILTIPAKLCALGIFIYVGWLRCKDIIDDKRVKERMQLYYAVLTLVMVYLLFFR